MNASKENARKAQRAVKRLVPEGAFAGPDDFKLLTEFLAAAERKLPTEAAFKRERQRRMDRAQLARNSKPRKR